MLIVAGFFPADAGFLAEKWTESSRLPSDNLLAGQPFFMQVVLVGQPVVVLKAFETYVTYCCSSVSCFSVWEFSENLLQQSSF